MKLTLQPVSSVNTFDIHKDKEQREHWLPSYDELVSPRSSVVCHFTLQITFSTMGLLTHVGKQYRHDQPFYNTHIDYLTSGGATKTAT